MAAGGRKCIPQTGVEGVLLELVDDGDQQGPHGHVQPVRDALHQSGNQQNEPPPAAFRVVVLVQGHQLAQVGHQSRAVYLPIGERYEHIEHSRRDSKRQKHTHIVRLLGVFAVVRMLRENQLMMMVEVMMIVMITLMMVVVDFVER